MNSSDAYQYINNYEYGNDKTFSGYGNIYSPNKVVKKDAEEFTILMKKLMDITDECAGQHVYIPVMGTKIALFGIDDLASFEYIKNAALNKKCSLRASISIVIFEESRDKVSIYD